MLYLRGAKVSDCIFNGHCINSDLDPLQLSGSGTYRLTAFDAHTSHRTIATRLDTMPRLSVVAGPSLDALVPISVNSGIPHDIVSDAFEGQILAYIKDFTDEEGTQNEYFQREDRKGITWSIQTQGTSLDLVLPPPGLR